MGISGIYKIQSITKSERIYVGSSYNINKRFNCHKAALRKGIHHSSKLQNHFNKYGETDLVFSMLLECELETLIEQEQHYIDTLKPFFNICPKAGSIAGHKIPDEVKQKMSIAKIGKKKSEETKKRMSVAQKGNKHRLGKAWSKESILKLSNSKMGQHPTLETRKKLHDSHLGHVPWNKGMKGLYSINKGKVLSDEHKRKLSESHKGITTWNKGKKGIYSVETLKKMSENNWKSRKLKVA